MIKGNKFSVEKKLTFSDLKTAFEKNTLFENKTWQLSPNPFPLNLETIEDIRQIGKACLHFYEAIDKLYYASVQEKSILRNTNLKANWVAEYFEKGKPEWLIKFQRQKKFKGQVPFLIRPDLLLCEEGLVLTELDSVPGGYGLTAFLYQLYFANKNNSTGGFQKMVDSFYTSLKTQCPQINNPTIAVIISEEAQDYRPEYEWLQKIYQKENYPFYCLTPSELKISSKDELYFLEKNRKNEVKIDIVYRFFELFDWENLPCLPLLIKALEKGTVKVTPFLKTFMEEKLNLALFHHPYLRDFWAETLPPESLSLLKKIIPESWVLDPSPFGPNALLNGPTIKGKLTKNWQEIGELSQKERQFIIKISGFHETCWGAKSVTLGPDVDQNLWKNKIQFALESFEKNPFIIQTYKKPKALIHPVFDSKGSLLSAKKGRVRLCPFYCVNNKEPDLVGVLTTFCPADKKIIHGMKDAALLPCDEF